MSWSDPLLETDVDADPIVQFNAWFDAATKAGTRAPEAMAVATAAADGAPSVRMVLLKQVDERGFVFFTNYESRKGQELTANPRASLMFNWELLGRQVRIEGHAQRVGAEETQAYVRSRPRASQMSALASPQSQVVESREVLEQLVAELTARYSAAEELPIPQNWGGFRVMPERIEFWQHRSDRLHDRLRYTRTQNGTWRIERLAP
jgi:pyridoxamine 5'-phosphate oxidase